MHKRTTPKCGKIVPAVFVFAILIPLAGCQAASNLFNPDTYSFDYNKEPWEKNIKRTKPSKAKPISTDY